MANQTLFPRTGNGAGIFIDTEVTAGGKYPVQGKGIKAYVDSAVSGAVTPKKFNFGWDADEEGYLYSGEYNATTNEYFFKYEISEADVSTAYGQGYINADVDGSPNKPSIYIDLTDSDWAKLKDMNTHAKGFGYAEISPSLSDNGGDVVSICCQVISPSGYDNKPVLAIYVLSASSEASFSAKVHLVVKA